MRLRPTPRHPQEHDSVPVRETDLPHPHRDAWLDKVAQEILHPQFLLINVDPNPAGKPHRRTTCRPNANEQITTHRVRKRRNARQEIELVLLVLERDRLLVLDLVALTNLILDQGRQVIFSDQLHLLVKKGHCESRTPPQDSNRRGPAEGVARRASGTAFLVAPNPHCCRFTLSLVVR